MKSLNPLSTGKSVQTTELITSTQENYSLNPLSTGKSVQTLKPRNEADEKRLNPLSTGKSVQTQMVQP